MSGARLRSILLVLIAGIGFVGAADAATLSVSPDKTTYLVGEVITLTVMGDDQGAVSDGIHGLLEYNGALVNIGTQSQTVGLLSRGIISFCARATTTSAGPDTAVSDAFRRDPPVEWTRRTTFPAFSPQRD